jgi:hypothetical protein
MKANLIKLSKNQKLKKYIYPVVEVAVIAGLVTGIYFLIKRRG